MPSTEYNPALAKTRQKISRAKKRVRQQTAKTAPAAGPPTPRRLVGNPKNVAQRQRAPQAVARQRREQGFNVRTPQVKAPSNRSLRAIAPKLRGEARGQEIQRRQRRELALHPRQYIPFYDPTVTRPHSVMEETKQQRAQAKLTEPYRRQQLREPLGPSVRRKTGGVFGGVVSKINQIGDELYHAVGLPTSQEQKDLGIRGTLQRAALPLATLAVTGPTYKGLAAGSRAAKLGTKLALGRGVSKLGRTRAGAAVIRAAQSESGQVALRLGGKRPVKLGALGAAVASEPHARRFTMRHAEAAYEHPGKFVGTTARAAPGMVIAPAGIAVNYALGGARAATGVKHPLKPISETNKSIADFTKEIAHLATSESDEDAKRIILNKYGATGLLMAAPFLVKGLKRGEPLTYENAKTPVGRYLLRKRARQETARGLENEQLRAQSEKARGIRETISEVAKAKPPKPKQRRTPPPAAEAPAKPKPKKPSPTTGQPKRTEAQRKAAAKKLAAKTTRPGASAKAEGQGPKPKVEKPMERIDRKVAEIKEASAKAKESLEKSKAERKERRAKAKAKANYKVVAVNSINGKRRVLSYAESRAEAEGFTAAERTAKAAGKKPLLTKNESMRIEPHKRAAKGKRPPAPARDDVKAQARVTEKRNELKAAEEAGVTGRALQQHKDELTEAQDALTDVRSKGGGAGGDKYIKEVRAKAAADAAKGVHEYKDFTKGSPAAKAYDDAWADAAEAAAKKAEGPKHLSDEAITKRVAGGHIVKTRKGRYPIANADGKPRVFKTEKSAKQAAEKINNKRTVKSAAHDLAEKQGTVTPASKIKERKEKVEKAKAERKIEVKYRNGGHEVHVNGEPLKTKEGKVRHFKTSKAAENVKYRLENDVPLRRKHVQSTRQAAPLPSEKQSKSTLYEAHDTVQQRVILDKSAAARKAREKYPQGTKIELENGRKGTVERHIPSTTSGGGSLRVKWEDGSTGTITTQTAQSRAAKPKGDKVNVRDPKDNKIVAANVPRETARGLIARLGDAGKKLIVEEAGVFHPGATRRVKQPEGNLGERRVEARGTPERRAQPREEQPILDQTLQNVVHEKARALEKVPPVGRLHDEVVEAYDAVIKKLQDQIKFRQGKQGIRRLPRKEVDQAALAAELGKLPQSKIGRRLARFRRKLLSERGSFVPGAEPRGIRVPGRDYNLTENLRGERPEGGKSIKKVDESELAVLHGLTQKGLPKALADHYGKGEAGISVYAGPTKYKSVHEASGRPMTRSVPEGQLVVVGRRTNGEVVGVMEATYNPRTKMVESIRAGVRDQGKGTGTKLARRLIEEAKSRGIAYDPRTDVLSEAGAGFLKKVYKMWKDETGAINLGALRRRKAEGPKDVRADDAIGLVMEASLSGAKDVPALKEWAAKLPKSQKYRSFDGSRQISIHDMVEWLDKNPWIWDDPHFQKGIAAARKIGRSQRWSERARLEVVQKIYGLKTVDQWVDVIAREGKIVKVSPEQLKFLDHPQEAVGKQRIPKKDRAAIEAEAIRRAQEEVQRVLGDRPAPETFGHVDLAPRQGVTGGSAAHPPSLGSGGKVHKRATDEKGLVERGRVEYTGEAFAEKTIANPAQARGVARALRDMLDVGHRPVRIDGKARRIVTRQQGIDALYGENAQYNPRDYVLVPTTFRSALTRPDRMRDLADAEIADMQTLLDADWKRLDALKVKGPKVMVVERARINEFLEQIKQPGKIERRAQRVARATSKLILYNYAWALSQIFATGAVAGLEGGPVRLPKALAASRRAAAKNPVVGDIIRSLAGAAPEAAGLRPNAGRVPIRPENRGKLRRWIGGLQTRHGAVRGSVKAIDGPATFNRITEGAIREAAFVAHIDKQLNSAFSGLKSLRKNHKELWESLQGKPLDEQLRLLTTSRGGRKALREMQRDTLQVIGDFSAITSHERLAAILGVFYPFMRMSVKFLTHGLPMRHPFKHALLLHLAQWNADELKKFLSGDPSFFADWATPLIRAGKGGATPLPLSRIAPGGSYVPEVVGEVSGGTNATIALRALNPAWAGIVAGATGVDPLSGEQVDVSQGKNQLALGFSTAFGSPAPARALVAYLDLKRKNILEKKEDTALTALFNKLSPKKEKLIRGFASPAWPRSGPLYRDLVLAGRGVELRSEGDPKGKLILGKLYAKYGLKNKLLAEEKKKHPGRPVTKKPSIFEPPKVKGGQSIFSEGAPKPKPGYGYYPKKKTASIFGE